MIEFEAGQKNATGYLALPASGRGPGVLVLHAWWGLNDFFKSLCDRLAGEGFVALAPDLYHGKVASTVEEAGRLRSKLDREVMGAALEHLRGHPAVGGQRVGVVGFSLGAHWALWLVEQHPEMAGPVVLFYGTRGGEYAQTQSAFLGHFAETDEYVSASSRKKLEKALRAAGREITCHVYPGTGHWFFESDRLDAYKPDAAELAWKRTVEFLRSHLTG